MSMFSYIMDLWACFHLSWIYEHVFFIYHGFMSMLFSSIMDLWACFFHLSWIYEHAFFIYHGFMSILFSSIMDLWECFHLSWIYEHVFFIYCGFMRMFSSVMDYENFFSLIMDLWACFHLSFFIHSITSSICIYDNLYHKKKRKIFFMIMFSFVILCQLCGTFILHVSQFVSYTIMSFLWCQQQAKFGGLSVLTSPKNPKAKTDVQWHIFFKLSKRPRLTTLNFLCQLSFWSKDVKTCTIFV